VAVGLLTLLWMAPVRAYFDQRTQITGLERQVQQLEDANARLRSQVSKLHDPAELERLARACLGMVRPGEVAFVTAPAGGGSYPRDC
jgi:cell division protein FtsB